MVNLNAEAPQLARRIQRSLVMTYTIYVHKDRYGSREPVLSDPHEIKIPTYRALCTVSSTMIPLNPNLLCLNIHLLDTAHKARYVGSWYILFKIIKLSLNFVWNSQGQAAARRRWG